MWFPSTSYKCLSEYAGKRVRYASAIVELVKRKPIEMIFTDKRGDYFYESIE